MRHPPTIPPLVLLAALSCDGGKDDTSPADDTGVAAGCEHPGNYTLESMVCNGIDVTEAFRAHVSDTTMTLTEGEPAGCHAVLVNAGPECMETMEYGAVAGGAEGTWDVTSDGITVCKPDACTFGKADEPCAVGDRAGTWTEEVVWTEGTLTATRYDALAPCTQWGQNPTVITWTLLAGS